MKYCDEYAALISAGVDNALTADERRKLMDHLAQCPACREAYTQILTMHQAFENWEEEIPGDLTGDVMAQIRKEKASTKRRKRSWLPVAAAAACCALVFIGYRHLPFGGESVNDVMEINQSASLADTAANATATTNTTATDDAALFTQTMDETDLCEEQILEGVLTFFRSAPAATTGAENAKGTHETDAIAADDPQSLPILTSSESALMEWMAANTSAEGYTGENGETTAWLITVAECEALTAYLTNEGLAYSTAWEQFHPDLPLPEGEDLVCVVYLPA